MPDDRDYHAGVAKLEAEDIDGAVALLRRAAEQQPDRARVHSNLGYALALAGAHDDARLAAERGRALAPDDPYTLWTLARVQSEAGDHEAAVASAGAVVADPAGAQWAPAAAVHAGWDQLQLGNWRAAAGSAREALARGDTSSSPWVLLAAALADGHWWGAAVAALERAVAADPDDDDVVERLSLARRGLDTVEGLLPEAEARARADGADWEAWHSLGHVLGMCGRVGEALDAFDRARALHPEPVYRQPGAASMLSPVEADCRLGLADVDGAPLRG